MEVFVIICKSQIRRILVIFSHLENDMRLRRRFYLMTCVIVRNFQFPFECDFTLRNKLIKVFWKARIRNILIPCTPNLPNFSRTSWQERFVKFQSVIVKFVLQGKQSNQLIIMDASNYLTLAKIRSEIGIWGGAVAVGAEESTRSQKKV